MESKYIVFAKNIFCIKCIRIKLVLYNIPLDTVFLKSDFLTSYGKIDKCMPIKLDRFAYYGTFYEILQDPGVLNCLQINNYISFCITFNKIC